MTLAAAAPRALDALDALFNPPPPQARPYEAQARPAQLPPDGDWITWLIMAGRGWGKTWVGANWLLKRATREVGDWAVIAPTFTDVRKVCVEGPSGIRAQALPGEITSYNRGTWKITLSNGSVIHMLSADQPDRIRGYNLRGAWCDELGAWRREDAWYDGLMPALRIGEHPQAVVTTTPRSTRLMRELAARKDDTVVFTRGSTWDNAANLSANALAEYKRWEGTTRGRQELHGELLDDMPGAAWRRHWIDDHRRSLDQVPDLARVVVAVDPSGTSHADSDEAGIITVGLDHDGDLWVIADDSGVLTPDAWARVAVHAYDKHGADKVVAERNFGADMVEATLRHVRAHLPVETVNASRGKAIRAEPIAALYEQGRVHHVGAFPELEDQLCTWSPMEKWSPDRLDALVWACTALTGPDHAADWVRHLERVYGTRAAEPEPVPVALTDEDRRAAARQAAFTHAERGTL